MTGALPVRRVLRIAQVLMRHRLDEFVLRHPRVPFGRALMPLLPWHWRRGEQAPLARRLRLALEDLGPIFVKFGQILSTRRDLLPPEYAEELVRLQDRVPPFPGVQARRIIETAYGRPLEAVFAEFDEQPLASASIAQVHAGRLKTGERIVVKVVRPRVEAQIRADLKLLYLIARVTEMLLRETRRLRPVEVVREYEHTIIDELDLLREAANASQLRRNFADTDELYVPEVYWEHTRANVMVMERISGIPVDRIDQMRAIGIDFEDLAEKGVEVFFRQVFEHNFFHADMHPGNVFVSPEGNYIAVDFGIVGSLSQADQRYLAENFVAFFNRDYKAVAQAHLRAGWIPPHTREDQFESAIRAVCEPIFDKPLRDISFGGLLLRLLQVARRFDMQVQPQLVLLQKTLLNIEGLGRQLYPDLDLWRTAKPFLERWMQEQMGWRALLKHSQAELPQLAEAVPQLPRLAFQVLRKAADGELEVHADTDELRGLRSEMRRYFRRVHGSIIGAALIVSGTLVYVMGEPADPVLLGGVPALSLILGGLGVVFIIANWPDPGPH